ncbi:uncharacterized protein Z518_11157 [Rhinocladiella mackenziei CBS 650.93]|uniref:Uncharacterized protein n=1 Tax=Rhinocladiella mackenziei CBS 650.93 TaxID=1442369 RepID=A0A0D2ISJ8_9EURO|nr:uncharacterized protein Z518_11157 [Rhinocladiella mackenziei CBS 650.93]KIW99744.1 hypothetical protein Z518_11157 [Rhinocladiella mackenziei CBS 650.93]
MAGGYDRTTRWRKTMDHLLMVCSQFDDYTVTLTQDLLSDLIEVTGESSNPRVTPSGGSEQDETYLPSRDSPFLEAMENCDTRVTRHRTTHAIVVGSSEMASDTYGHEQIRHERADEKPRSPVSMTAASTQAPQENDNTSGVTDTVTFHGIGRTWYFGSVEQKAQVLEAVANGVAIACTDDIVEMERRKDEETDAMDLFYQEFVFPVFQNTLHENGAQPRQCDISHPSDIIYRGESLHSRSIEEKAEALQAGMVKLEEKIDWYFDQVKIREDQITYRRLSSYYKKKYLRRMEKLLLANGAELRPPTHIANSRD